MIVVNAARCPQNHRCPTLRVCPTGALQQEGFNAPFIDQELCIECGKCAFSCPVFTQLSDGLPALGRDRGSSTSGNRLENPRGLGRFLSRLRSEATRPER